MHFPFLLLASSDEQACLLDMLENVTFQTNREVCIWHLRIAKHQHSLIRTLQVRHFEKNLHQCNVSAIHPLYPDDFTILALDITLKLVFSCKCQHYFMDWIVILRLLGSEVNKDVTRRKKFMFIHRQTTLLLAKDVIAKSRSWQNDVLKAAGLESDIYWKWKIVPWENFSISRAQSLSDDFP